MSGVRDVLRHDAQAGSLRSNLLSKRRRAEHVKMTYAERVAETNGPIYETDILCPRAGTDACHPRHPSPQGAQTNFKPSFSAVH